MLKFLKSCVVLVSNFTLVAQKYQKNGYLSNHSRKVRRDYEQINIRDI